MSVLSLKNGVVHYKGVQALRDVSLTLERGEIVLMLGPNGAGKSTALRSLIGLAPLSSGEVAFEGSQIVPIPHEMPTRGVAYVPQGRQIFKHMNVYENLEMGGYVQKGSANQKIELILDFFPMLRAKLLQKAGTLSGGEQQMLTLGRALISDPKVLLLDEPSLGLSPKMVKEVFEKIREIHEKKNVGILIIEHSIKSALAIAHRVYVLTRGEVVWDGEARKLESATLEKVFLGA